MRLYLPALRPHGTLPWWADGDGEVDRDNKVGRR